VNEEVKAECADVSIASAKCALEEFDYEKGLNICLELLKQDYENYEAHMLILQTFHTLGFKNDITIATKDQLKAIMLYSHK